MSNTKPIYQMWFEKDYVLDTGHLPWQANLVFRCLLQKAFPRSTPYLPDNDEALAALAGVPMKVWDSVKSPVRSMFIHMKIEGEKVLAHKRLIKDWNEVHTFREKQRELANRKWSKLRKNANADAKAATSADASAMPVEKSRDRVEQSKERVEHKSSLPSLPASAERPAAKQQLSVTQETQIRMLQGEGHDVRYIASRLELPHGLVEDYLAENGLVSTR